MKHNRTLIIQALFRAFEWEKSLADAWGEGTPERTKSIALAAKFQNELDRYSSLPESVQPTAKAEREWRVAYEVKSVTDRTWNPYATAPSYDEASSRELLKVYAAQPDTRKHTLQRRIPAGPWDDYDVAEAGS